MDKLKFINEQMDILGIPYEFGEWKSTIQYPYFVGEITEEEYKERKAVYVETILELYVMGIIGKEEMYEKLNS